MLLLDVMDTLVREPFREDLPRFFGLSLSELIRDKDPTAWLEFERGEIDEVTFVARFFADRRPVDCEAMKRAMTDAYAWLEGVEPLLAELKARGVEMHVLSNYSRWYELIEAKLGVSRYVPWTFVSCHTGHRKPEPRAYRDAAAALGVRPERCVLVDDRPGNVEVARALGMTGVVRTPEIGALRSALRALGLL